MSTEKVNEKVVPVDVHSVESLHNVNVNGKDIAIDDGDEIMKLGLADDDVELTPEVERKLLRKIDMYMLPIMCAVYCCQFMDKISNSFASILGLRVDLKMEGQEYAWTGSAFYLGYLVFELPASYLLQKLPVAKTVGVFIVCWGFILCMHAVPKSYPGFVTLRTLLGAFESSVTPAFTFITSQWYTIDETFLRISIWFACNGLGYILGSLIAYGLSVHDGSYSIVSWKLIFIITGVLTLALGIVILFHLPNSPATAWFLTDTEKHLIVQRNRKNHQGFGNKHFKKDQLIEVFTDYKTYLLLIFSFCGNLPNGGLTNFGSILMTETLHFSTERALLLQCAGGAVEFGGCILIAYMSRFYKSRMLWALVGQCIASAGQLMLCWGHASNLRFAGFNLNFVAPVSFICVLSCVASNVLGTTKKFVTNVIVLIAYCVGNLIGSALFKDSEAPVFQTAKSCIAATAFIQIGVVIAIGASYLWENKKRDRKPEPEKIDNIEFLDLTDLQNPFFRYSY